MEREEEKHLIRQSNEMHEIIVGTGEKPGLCEDVRLLDKRVGRIEGGAKWVLGIFSTIFMATMGFVWHRVLRQ